MNNVLEYRIDSASELDIARHLSACDADFSPALSTRLEIRSYAKKLFSQATRFEAWLDDVLIGLLAAYCNDREKQVAYITNVSVVKSLQGRGIAGTLLDQCRAYASYGGFTLVRLEVAKSNVPAVKLYKKKGFTVNRTDDQFIRMDLQLNSESI